MKDLAKIPPQAIDMEEAVLAALMIEKEAIDIVVNILTVGSFYKESHGKIYTAILSLYTKHKPIDLLTVSEYLRNQNELDEIGGPVYLAKLTEKVSSSAHVEYHAQIIAQKFLQRELIRIASEIQKRAFDDTYDIKDLMDFSESELFKISSATQSKEPKRMDVCVDTYLIELANIINGHKEFNGVPSGFTKIDRMTGGWQKTDLIILAGRPSMGKTALALSLGKGAAEHGFPVGIFSLEMSESQLTGRYLSEKIGRSNIELRMGRVDYDKLCIESNDIANLPIYIDDTPGITLFELRSKVKKLIIKQGIKLVIVDYLQLMRHEAGNREQEISQISQGLKAIAKEFNIPVIALSQLNRDCEKRSDKMPQLSDLRESGAIEQDADIVGFIHRPEKYGINTVWVNDAEISSKGVMLFIFAKNRNGACVPFALYYSSDALTNLTDEEPGLINEPF
jgi:replicative DNA helicase